MGLQSSRIIWGRDRMPGANAPQPVGVYDPNGTIYICGNYAIHCDGEGDVANNYHLYLCGAAETGSTWNAEDWKLQKGVKNWYLVDFKNFKKGARVIKEDTNGDFDTIKLYRCKNGMSTPNVWKDSEWEVVYQDVGVAYQARDHKEVYYNGYWHKMMYYLPPYYDYAEEFDPQVTYYKGDRCMVGETKYEYMGKEPYQGTWAERNPADWIIIDERITEEIMMFDENRQYHYQDYAIKVKPGLEQKKALYQYINHTPRSGWNPANWTEIDDVEEYEAYRAYAKNERCIKLQIEIWDCRIVEFQSNVSYNTGKHCIRYIDKQRIDPDILNWTAQTLYNGGDRCAHDGGIYQFNVTLPAPVAGPWNPANWDYLRPTYPDDIRDRILSDEQLFGLYRCNKPVNGLWNDEDWDLIINEQVTLKGHIYNTARLPIYEFQLAKNYVEGELCIWAADKDSSELGLSVAKQDIFNASYNQAPPNETYWQSLNELNDSPNSYYIYKAKNAISAEDNSHFQRDNWLIVTQKVLPDDGDYGVIWEKYGIPGGGGFPFWRDFSCCGWPSFGGFDSVAGRFGVFYSDGVKYHLNMTGGSWSTSYDDNTKKALPGTGFNKLVTYQNGAFGYLEVPMYTHDSRRMSQNAFYHKVFGDWKKVELLNFYYIGFMPFAWNKVYMTANYVNNMDTFTIATVDLNSQLVSIETISLQDLHPGYQQAFNGGSYMYGSHLSAHYDTPFPASSEVPYVVLYRGGAFSSMMMGHAYRRVPGTYHYVTEHGIKDIKSETYYVYYCDDGSVGFDGFFATADDYWAAINHEYFGEDIAAHCGVMRISLYMWSAPSSEWLAIANSAGLNIQVAEDGNSCHTDNYPLIGVITGISMSYGFVAPSFYGGGRTYLYGTCYCYSQNPDTKRFDGVRLLVYVVKYDSYGNKSFKIIYSKDIACSGSFLGPSYGGNGTGFIIEGTTDAEAIRDAMLSDSSVPLFLGGTRSSAVYNGHIYIPNTGTISVNPWNGSEVSFSSDEDCIWDFDLTADTLTKITNCPRGITARYVSENGVYIYGLGRITRLSLSFFGGIYGSRNDWSEYTYIEDGVEKKGISVWMELNEHTLFSASTNSPVQARDGSLLVWDYFEINYYTYTIYVYIPNATTLPRMNSSGAIFWISSGYNWNSTSYGPFYGSVGKDKTRFDIDIVG